jgi:hypothetical protein
VPIAAGVFLQSTPSLAAPNWVNLTDIPTRLDGQNQLTFTPTATSGCFRLNFTQ